MNKQLIFKYLTIGVLIILFGLFIYPGLYEYDKFNQRIPVKVNRITGEAHLLSGDTWERVGNPKDSEPRQVEMLKAELQKDREQIKKEVIDEVKNQIKKDVLTELENVKKEITAYKKFQTDPENYFSIGSTKEEVKAIMGTPTSIDTYLDSWTYGRSTVTFKNGKVSEYDNFGRNLRIK